MNYLTDKNGEKWEVVKLTATYIKMENKNENATVNQWFMPLKRFATLILENYFTI